MFVGSCLISFGSFWLSAYQGYLKQDSCCGPAITNDPSSVPSKDEEVGKVQRVKQSFEEPEGIVALIMVIVS